MVLILGQATTQNPQDKFIDILAHIKSFYIDYIDSINCEMIGTIASFEAGSEELFWASSTFVF